MNDISGSAAEPAPPGPARKVSERIRARLPAFLSRQNAEIERLPELLRNGDLEGIVHIGHKLNGSCAGYGLPELGLKGADLEAAALDGQLDAIALHTASLQALMGQILSEQDLAGTL